MGYEYKKLYSVLAETVAKKVKQEYFIIISYQQQKISFSLMRSILLSIRGSRTKNWNQEGLNVENDIKKNEWLWAVREQ